MRLRCAGPGADRSGAGRGQRGVERCSCRSGKTRARRRTSRKRMAAGEGEMVGSAGARSGGSARQPATGRARPDPNKEAGRRQGKRQRLGEGLGAGASDEAGRDSSSTRARNRGNSGGLVLAMWGDGCGQRETRASGRLVLCSSRQEAEPRRRCRNQQQGTGAGRSGGRRRRDPSEGRRDAQDSGRSGDGAPAARTGRLRAAMA